MQQYEPESRVSGTPATVHSHWHLLSPRLATSSLGILAAIVLRRGVRLTGVVKDSTSHEASDGESEGTGPRLYAGQARDLREQLTSR